MSAPASISDNISKFLQLVTLTKNTVNPSSLSSIVKQTNVEPFCVISKDCVNLEYITDVNSTLLNMFCAYYLQAISTITRLSDVRIKKILNAVGTNTQFSLESVSLNADVLKFKLPNSTNLSLESELTDKFKDVLSKVPGHNGRDYPNAKSGLSENSQEYYNTANLAIGKIIEVTITLDGGVRTFNKTKTSTTNDNGVSNYFEGNNIVPDNTTVTERESTTKGTEQQIIKNDDVLVTIPIHVRLLVNVVGPKTIDSLLVRHKEDISFDERWYSWRSGRISFWKDLVLCQDLIRERKRQALDSDGEVVNSIDARVRNAILQKVAKMSIKTYGGKATEIKDTDTMSFGVASNLYVITAAEASRIEYHLHGKLSDTKTRNKLFGNGYAMILAVIDPDRERVKFYINGVDGFTDLSVREIKSMSKNKGPDISDMLKMMQMGMAPTF